MKESLKRHKEKEKPSTHWVSNPQLPNNEVSAQLLGNNRGLFTRDLVVTSSEFSMLRRVSKALKPACATYFRFVVGNGCDVGVLQDGAVVPQPSELRVHLLQRAGHQDLLLLGLRGLEGERFILEQEKTSPFKV